MATLIAEIGNNHFGSLTRFKDMIKIAKLSGADMVKAQAIMGPVKGGTMPDSFYEDVALDPREYLEAMEYGDAMDMPVFYSIFHPDLSWLLMHQVVHKISASQMLKVQYYGAVDNTNIIVSLNDEFLDSGRIHYFKPKHATVLYASPYNASTVNLRRLSEITAPTVGYSDHSVGIRSALSAVRDYGAEVIEKHFTLDRAWEYRGHVFRDTVHGALPYELESLAKGIQ